MKRGLVKRAYLLLFLPVFLAISACGLTDQILGTGDEAATAAPVVALPEDDGQSDPVVPDSGAAAAPTVTAPADGPAEAGDQNVDQAAPAPAAPITDLTAAAALEDTLVNVYERVSPSVVYIQTAGGTGSGFVWDTAGHIVTNNHVVAGANQIVIVFSDGRFANATIVGTDVDSDLAVLALATIPTTLQPVIMGDSTQLKVGEIAIAIGSPFGQTGTMTVGFVSALGRLQPVDATSGAATSFNMSDLIQTDAAINPGNSGGVLVDENGLLIGVTSSIISPVRGSTGIGLAIPSVAVSRIVPALIETGSYAHPYLGVSGGTLTPERAAALGLPAETRGTVLIEVVANGPAAQAGLRGGETTGDVIVAINGKAVNSMDELITYLARYGVAGEDVTLSILRDGQRQEISVQLGARPAG